MNIAAKLFIELTWAEAGGVIAGAVLVGRMVYGIIAEVARGQKQ